MITISIGKADTECVDKVTLTSGMVKAVQVAFSFSEQWDGFNKTAVFSNGNTTLDVSLDDEGKCYIPHEVVAEVGKEVSVGVYGCKGTGDDYIAIPTEKCSLGKVVEGVDPTGEEPAEPTPTVYDELKIIVNDLQAGVYRNVDLTKVTTVTESEATITEDEIKPVNYYGGFVKGVINVTGYCEIEVKNTGIDYVFLHINGEEYFARRYGDGDETALLFKGVVNEPIEFAVEPSAVAKFAKFVTTTDYELHNKVGDLEKALDDLPESGGSVLSNDFVLIGDATLTEDAEAFKFTQDLEGNDLTKYKDFFLHFVGDFTGTSKGLAIRANEGGIYLMWRPITRSVGSIQGFWHLTEEMINTDDGLIIYKSNYPDSTLTNYTNTSTAQGLSNNNRNVFSDIHCNGAGMKISSYEFFIQSGESFKAGSRCMLFGRLR